MMVQVNFKLRPRAMRPALGPQIVKDASQSASPLQI